MRFACRAVAALIIPLIRPPPWVFAYINKISPRASRIGIYDYIARTHYRAVRIIRIVAVLLVDEFGRFHELIDIRLRLGVVARLAHPYHCDKNNSREERNDSNDHEELYEGKTPLVHLH